jgi:hypothetical protein
MRPVDIKILILLESDDSPAITEVLMDSIVDKDAPLTVDILDCRDFTDELSSNSSVERRLDRPPFSEEIVLTFTLDVNPIDALRVDKSP